MMSSLSDPPPRLASITLVLFWLSLSSSSIGLSEGFAFPIEKSIRRPVDVTSPLARTSWQRRTTSVGPSSLKYRALDEDDDDATLLKVQSRLPPNFDTRNALSSLRRSPTGLNLQFISALLVNQALILGVATALGGGILLITEGPGFVGRLPEILHWEGPISESTLGLFDLTPTPQRVALGLVGSIPLLVNNFLIEASDRRVFANINFSTIAMVMTLFGRRSPPDEAFVPPKLRGVPFPTTTVPQAFVASVALAGMTGFCEETVFRREVSAVLGEPFLLDHNVALILGAQALLFALGHIQPGSNSRSENAVLLGLQLVNGLGFGAIYLLGGGDIVPCMVAHAAYDLVDFFKTWMDANGQLEYAERMWKSDLSAEDQARVRDVLRATGMSLDDAQYRRFRRMFYTFDFDKNNSLSRSEVRKGIAYMAVERAGTPPPTEQVDLVFDRVKQPNSGDRLAFPDFLRLIYESGGLGGNKKGKMPSPA